MSSNQPTDLSHELSFHHLDIAFPGHGLPDLTKDRFYPFHLGRRGLCLPWFYSPAFSSSDLVDGSWNPFGSFHLDSESLEVIPFSNF